MKHYQAGDQVWWAHYGMREVRVTCPICYGKLIVTLILGNGDRVELPCDYCGKGFEGPRGFMVEHMYSADVELVTINEVRTHSRLDGPDVIEYITGISGRGGHYLDPEDVFETKEEAFSRSLAKAQEQSLRDITIAEHLKHDAKKSFSWNAGYHLREAKHDRQSAEYHELKARICKERSKELPTSE